MNTWHIVATETNTGRRAEWESRGDPQQQIAQLTQALRALRALWKKWCSSSRPQIYNAVYREWHTAVEQEMDREVEAALAASAAPETT